MKTMNMIVTLILGILMTAEGQEAENLQFGDWDKDGNGLISRSEFISVFRVHYYEDWNNRNDEYLDDEDFYHISYAMWDTDEDSLISEDEYIDGFEYYYEDYVADDFIVIDVDDDGMIEHDEFVDVLDKSDFFESWDFDADEHLTELEIARGVFNNWDRDDSNFIDPKEYESFDSFYLDI
jgi:Ca2+-binding EF-hand superfamily protein